VLLSNRVKPAIIKGNRSFAMGAVYTEITLVNSHDGWQAREGLIAGQDVHSVTVQALVDTGAMSLVINEELQQKLGLKTVRKRFAQIANGQRVVCEETDPVDITWKDRGSTLRAVVIPGAKTVLLGALPLEDLDLMVNPVTQELVGVHGDAQECFAF
jgi:clan AA aspartic protease